MYDFLIFSITKIGKKKQSYNCYWQIGTFLIDILNKCKHLTAMS